MAYSQYSQSHNVHHFISPVSHDPPKRSSKTKKKVRKVVKKKEEKVEKPVEKERKTRIVLAPKAKKKVKTASTSKKRDRKKTKEKKRSRVKLKEKPPMDRKHKPPRSPASPSKKKSFGSRISSKINFFSRFKNKRYIADDEGYDWKKPKMSKKEKSLTKAQKRRSIAIGSISRKKNEKKKKVVDTEKKKKARVKNRRASVSVSELRKQKRDSKIFRNFKSFLPEVLLRKKDKAKRRNQKRKPKAKFTRAQLKNLQKQTLHFDNGFYKGTVSTEKFMKDDGSTTIKVRMHGFGTYFYDNGAKYEGEFIQNIKEGKGTYFYPNENIYKGEFRKNQQHGFGLYLFSDGSKYHGDFVMGKKHGNGKLYWPNGDIRYDGEFKNNMKHGLGMYLYQNKGKYIGQWVNDMKHGLGALKYGQNDDDWIGFFENDQKKRDYMQCMLQELGLRKYYSVIVEKGFSLTMLKTMDDEDLEALLLIIFKEHASKVKKYLCKNKDLILKLVKDM